MIYVMEILCAFLTAMSLVFILVQLRAKFDRSYLIFGIFNLLICFFCAIDIWVQPHTQILSWTTLQHVIASFFPPLFIWHIMLIVKKERMVRVKLLFLVGIVFSVLFLTGAMLKPSSNEVTGTLVYNLTFAPYFAAMMMFLLWMVVTNLKRVGGYEKRLLQFHFAGMILLCCGGLIDFVCIIVGYRLFGSLPSCTMLGALGFSFVVTMIFAERLARIVREREITFDKLREAYKELEQVQTLKELGQSTAIINHEIRNYSAVISGYSEMLLMSETLDEESRRIVGQIGECITRLTNFSQDILELSKSRIVKETVPLSIRSILKNCIEMHFPKNKETFALIQNDTGDIQVNGDWGKLEQIFVNIFRNSLEAGAQKIIIRLKQSASVVLCSIEDNGEGCSEDQIQKIFKSFYTTKKNKGGTGLGMCVVRSVIEGHGGHISAYTKNGLGKGQHGLVLHISFPRYESESVEADKKHDIVLVKEGIEDLANLIRVFQNIKVNPHVVQSVSELDSLIYELRSMTILAAPVNINRYRVKYGSNRKALALVEGRGKALYVLDELGNNEPHLFCEEFLINHLLSDPA